MSREAAVEAFLSEPGIALDVRSPAEFIQGRLPGALNLPLFDNAQRALVGTTYKQVGRDSAVLQGLELVGPKLAAFARQAREWSGGGPVKVYCWRGGMRSGAMAWLLETSGLPALTLKGGYKAFRRWALAALAQPRQIKLLGGLTGSGKTRMLRSLKDKGEQVLDLEEVACHRGSAYGRIGLPEQPSNEQFENEIAVLWAGFDPSKPVWVEDESRMIGKCKVPDLLFAAMRAAPLLLMERPLEERLKLLTEEYALNDPVELMACTEKLSRKLGGARAKEIGGMIAGGELAQAMREVLRYYDDSYLYGLARRHQPFKILEGKGLDDRQWLDKLLERGEE